MPAMQRLFLMYQLAALDDFDLRLAKHHLRGQWKSEGFLSAAIGGPRPAGEATKWRWRQVTEFLNEAGEIMPESLQARRSLIFQNPGLQRGTTHTINMGVQMILPGEVAWSHRHSISALRFIIEGSRELTTIVDGQHCFMETGDLVLTPNWSWHDHHNSGDKNAFWLDVLDVPLVLGLNQVFYQPGVVEEQPAVDDGIPRGIMRFPWVEAMEAVWAVPLDPVRGQCHEYSVPGTVKACLPTIACRLIRLPPGFTGKSFRTTTSTVGFVVRGSARLQLSDGPMDLIARDSFVVPNWAWYSLNNNSSSDDVVIFMVDDEPVIRALGFMKTEIAP